MRTRIGITAAALVLLLAGPAPAQLIRYQDNKGNVHFTNEGWDSVPDQYLRGATMSDPHQKSQEAEGSSPSMDSLGRQVDQNRRVLDRQGREFSRRDAKKAAEAEEAAAEAKRIEDFCREYQSNTMKGRLQYRGRSGRMRCEDQIERSRNYE